MPSAPQFAPRLRDVKRNPFWRLNAYENDRAYRQQMDLEARHAHDLSMAAMDRGMIANDTRFPAQWTPQEKLDAIGRMMK